MVLTDRCMCSGHEHLIIKFIDFSDTLWGPVDTVFHVHVTRSDATLFRLKGARSWHGHGNTRKSTILKTGWVLLFKCSQVKLMTIHSILTDSVYAVDKWVLVNCKGNESREPGMEEVHCSNAPCDLILGSLWWRTMPVFHQGWSALYFCSCRTLEKSILCHCTCLSASSLYESICHVTF